MAADIPRSKQKSNDLQPYSLSRAPQTDVLTELFTVPLNPQGPDPLYDQIAGRIRMAIQMHKLLPGTRLPSEMELCSLLGVSRNTVMRAVNGLREEGLLFRERGSGTYVRHAPNQSTKSLPTARLGIVSPTSQLSMDDLYLGGILSGLSQALKDIGAVALLGSPSINPSSDYFTEITRRDIDGFIVIAPSQRDRNAVAVLARNNVPFVLVGADFDPEWDAVTTDNQMGVRLALEHLTAMGHERIGYIGAPGLDYDSSERWEAFHESLGPRAARFSLRLSAKTDWEEQISQMLTDRLQGPEPLTAVITGGYPISLAAMRAFQRLRVTVPHTVSLVGYDDYTMMEYLSPSLTTIRQPLGSMGALAARLLTARVRGQIQDPVHHVLPVELVVRGSTAPTAQP